MVDNQSGRKKTEFKPAKQHFKIDSVTSCSYGVVGKYIYIYRERERERESPMMPGARLFLLKKRLVKNQIYTFTYD